MSTNLVCLNGQSVLVLLVFQWHILYTLHYYILRLHSSSISTMMDIVVHVGAPVIDMFSQSKVAYLTLYLLNPLRSGCYLTSSVKLNCTNVDFKPPEFIVLFDSKYTDRFVANLIRLNISLTMPVGSFSEILKQKLTLTTRWVLQACSSSLCLTSPHIGVTDMVNQKINT